MKNTRVIHPILMALFPVLFLYSHNMDEYSLRVIILPTLVLVVFTLVGWALGYLVLKEWRRPALLVSFFLLLSFSYGHLYNILWHFFAAWPLAYGPRSAVFYLYLFLLVVGAVLIIRLRRSRVAWTRLANVVAVVLVAVPSARIVSYPFTSRITLPEHQTADGERKPAEDLSLRHQLPDIYYIIADAYARADVLKELYPPQHYTLFEYLKEKGFYIASQAEANYCQTTLSFASSLNMKYLDPTIDHLDPDSHNSIPLTNLLFHNRVFEFLEGRGYLSVAFTTGYYYTEMKTADVFYAMEQKTWYLDEFQDGLLSNSPLTDITERLIKLMPSLVTGLDKIRFDTRRRTMLYPLERLQSLPSRSQPQFVFAHIILPHYPFVFGPNGERVSPPGGWSGTKELSQEEYTRRYADQLAFTDKLLVATLDSIFARSERPPIIILQSDHGPGSRLDWENPQFTPTMLKERFSILNAYYLPQGGDSGLYQSISPVNTFRHIFNHYFDADYKLLPDRSYFSHWGRPYDFIDVVEITRMIDDSTAVVD